MQDIFKGVPFNRTMYALLTYVIAQVGSHAHAHAHAHALAVGRYVGRRYGLIGFTHRALYYENIYIYIYYHRVLYYSYYYITLYYWVILYRVLYTHRVLYYYIIL
jgi:hypothetical protein